MEIRPSRDASGWRPIPALEESAEEFRCFIGDADDLVCCLTIELEIELGLGSAVVPVGKTFELAPTEALFRRRSPSDGDAHAWRLPPDTALLRDRFSRSDDAPRYETRAAFSSRSQRRRLNRL